MIELYHERMGTHAAAKMGQLLVDGGGDVTGEEHTVEIVGQGSPTTYTIAFSGTLVSTEGLGPLDSVTQSGGDGRVVSGTDTYVGTGDVEIMNTGDAPFVVRFDDTQEVTLEPGQSEMFPEEREIQGPLVSLSCEGFDPTSVRADQSFTLTAAPGLVNNDNQSHDITLQLVVNGNVVQETVFTVPGGQSIEREFSQRFQAPQSDPNLPSSGSAQVVLRQRFGRQQEATCGSVTIEEPPQQDQQQQQPREEEQQQRQAPPRQRGISQNLLLQLGLLFGGVFAVVALLAAFA